MQWLQQYRLFLLDFDGLLVNTEEIHYQAYKKMCSDRGVELEWDFPTYCKMAHYSADALKKEIYRQYPQLIKQESNWDVLYSEKKRAYLKLLDQGTVELMPGASELLQALADSGISHCVVTNSAEELIQKIIQQCPLLKSIPHWITRERYIHPKPHPECYQKAIELFAKPDDPIIGIEDTPRGLKALLQTRAEPVLVSGLDYPEIEQLKEQGVACYRSLYQFMQAKELEYSTCMRNRP